VFVVSMRSRSRQMSTTSSTAVLMHSSYQPNPAW
jgi:hypothetical protein